MSVSNTTINDGFAYIYDDGEDTVEDLLMKNANLRKQFATLTADYNRLRDELAGKYVEAHDLRAELTAARAEIERLQKEMDAIVSLDELVVDKSQQIKVENERLRRIIVDAEWGKSVHTAWDKYQRCAICGNKQSNGHDVNCPFYQWEGNNK